MKAAALHQLLGSVAQIYFQSAPAFGLALLCCLLLADPLLVCGGLYCAAIACGVAWLAGFCDDQRQQGRYSFNAALSGIGLCASYQICIALAAWAAGVAVLAALISRITQRSAMPVLTSPFVLAMWLSAAVAPSLGLEPRMAPLGAAPDVGFLSGALAAIGAISFVPGGLLGGVLIGALACQEWRGGVWLLSGAILGLVVGNALNLWFPVAALVQGMAANCALTGLGLHFFAINWAGRIGGMVSSCVLCLLFASAGIPAYTAPFILASWLILWCCGGLRCSPQAPPPAR